MSRSEHNAESMHRQDTQDTKNTKILCVLGVLVVHADRSAVLRIATGIATLVPDKI